MKMLAENSYRFVRSLGFNASLHAVTFRGIDDFLESDDAGDGGLVMLLHGPAGHESGGLHGGPDIGAILRLMKDLPDDMQASARPLAVVTIAGMDLKREVCERLARRLMDRVSDNAHPSARDDLGAYETLVEDVANAIPQVLGVNPFLDRAVLN